MIDMAPMESLPTTTRVQSQAIIRTDVPRGPNSFRAGEGAQFWSAIHSDALRLSCLQADSGAAAKSR
jgi:hypothetical protein